jgi:phosphoketolase
MGQGVAAAGQARGPLSQAELRLLDRWWRAANYRSLGQICLLDQCSSCAREDLEIARQVRALLRPG